MNRSTRVGSHARTVPNARDSVMLDGTEPDSGQRIAVDRREESLTVDRYSASPNEKFSTSLSSASASGGRKEVPANESASMRATRLVRR
jgi:hypothetical protein